MKWNNSEGESNIIVAGLNAIYTMKDEVKKMLNEKLTCSIKSEDVRYTLKFKKVGADEADGTCRTRVVFASKDIKIRIVKTELQMKG